MNALGPIQKSLTGTPTVTFTEVGGDQVHLFEHEETFRITTRTREIWLTRRQAEGLAEYLNQWKDGNWPKDC